VDAANGFERRSKPVVDGLRFGKRIWTAIEADHIVIEIIVCQRFDYLTHGSSGGRSVKLFSGSPRG
jgi:hypothetical protein